MQNICTVKHLYSRYPLVCSSQTVKAVRAQSFPIQLHTPHIIAPPLSKNRKNYDRPSWLGPAPTRSALKSQAKTGWKTKDSQILASTDASFTQPLRRGRDLPFSFIPNKSLSRQEKSLKLCLLFQHPQKYLIPQFIAEFLFGRRRQACPERSRRGDAIISY